MSYVYNVDNFSRIFYAHDVFCFVSAWLFLLSLEFDRIGYQRIALFIATTHSSFLSSFFYSTYYVVLPSPLCFFILFGIPCRLAGQSVLAPFYFILSLSLTLLERSDRRRRRHRYKGGCGGNVSLSLSLCVCYLYPGFMCREEEAAKKIKSEN
ncbi:hypothetical protein B0T26DRAFT_722013 [Lasiosphaeria miniovina]|uniref:Uncharacterized protein n=1 Tax=Lasiosphaeria miniovina TaxID=1954250 RepID=A0AA40A5L1_9PEZI|nr:uncharacterized protein B0T26DRAFT_722013 [Lasiosphaeria miniovina]KAK0709558.1 hypothetical protein B0T26DRAFT_722013 [Lasiosphaeria miniovina]